MSELSELPPNIESAKELPDGIPSELIRSADGARIKIIAEAFEVNRSPHSIGESYVSEGVVLSASVTKDLHVYNGRPNAYRMGRLSEFTELEMVPLILVARGENGGPWLDCGVDLRAADTMVLDGKRVHFTKFAEFEGAMDLETLSRVLRKEHQYSGAPIDAFKLIKEELGRVLELDECALTVIALWIAMTYVFDSFDSFPYLWFNGVKGSGKSTALRFIHLTGYHSVLGHRITNPALFRFVHQHKATVCYDEAENLLVGGPDKSVDQDRVSLFNSGYQASGKVLLVEKEGDNFKTRLFSSYSPKALASVNPIEESLQSRCLLVSMLIALEDKKLINTEKCLDIRRKLFEFRFAEGPAFWDMARDADKDDKMRKKYDLKNREWEIFKPLLLGAEFICPDWLPAVRSFIADQQIIRQVDNQLSTDATVLLKLLESIDEGENAPEDAKTHITYKEFMAGLKEDCPELKWMTNKSIGNCLRRLGLTKLTARYGKGYIIRFDRELVSKQVERLGLEEVKIAPPKPEGLEKFDEGASA